MTKFENLLKNIRNNIKDGLKPNYLESSDPNDLEIYFPHAHESDIDDFNGAMEQNRQYYNESSILDLVKIFILDGQAEKSEKLPNLSLLPNLEIIEFTGCKITGCIDFSKNTNLIL